MADGGATASINSTPNGVRTIFASGLHGPVGLAFDSAGNLFVTAGGDIVVNNTGKVYKFTPGGARTTFASGFTSPVSLAFDSTGNLFVADEGDIDGLAACPL